MPEAATDRPTRCHEYLFLLAKQPHYYYDAAAIREPWAPSTALKHRRSGYRRAFTNQGHGVRRAGPGRQSRAWTAVRQPGLRNRRTVWTVGTQSYRGAHVAVFPPELIRPCVRAGCPTGGTVLDPFAGSGTTGLVAEQEGRIAVLIELNAQYVDLQRERTGPRSRTKAGRRTTRKRPHGRGAAQLQTPCSDQWVKTATVRAWTSRSASTASSTRRCGRSWGQPETSSTPNWSDRRRPLGRRSSVRFGSRFQDVFADVFGELTGLRMPPEQLELAARMEANRRIQSEIGRRISEEERHSANG